jgi:hypothetical protein
MEYAKSQFDKNILTKGPYVTFNPNTKLWHLFVKWYHSIVSIVLVMGNRVQQFL